MISLSVENILVSSGFFLILGTNSSLAVLNSKTGRPNKPILSICGQGRYFASRIHLRQVLRVVFPQLLGREILN